MVTVPPCSNTVRREPKEETVGSPMETLPEVTTYALLDVAVKEAEIVDQFNPPIVIPPEEFTMLIPEPDESVAATGFAPVEPMRSCQLVKGPVVPS